MSVNNLPMAETCIRELQKAKIIEDTVQGDNEWATDWAKLLITTSTQALLMFWGLTYKVSLLLM